MNADKPTILVPAQIGAPFEGGFYGGQIRSGAKTFAVIWAPKALGETKAAWLPKRKLVPGATSCFHSMDNTRAMAEAGSKLARWALALNIDGHTDWCLPARDVLELAYRHLKPGTDENSASFRDGDNPSSIPPGYPYTDEAPTQTTVAAFQDGGNEAFEQSWYWSSTQYSEDYAWGQDFDDGFQDSYGKSYEAQARAVRLIQLNP
jgi:hypothetical protein